MPGSFTLIPGATMRNDLKRDYEKMSGMIFGDIPTMDEILASVVSLEDILNIRPNDEYSHRPRLR